MQTALYVRLNERSQSSFTEYYMYAKLLFLIIAIKELITVRPWSENIRITRKIIRDIVRSTDAAAVVTAKLIL